MDAFSALFAYLPRLLFATLVLVCSYLAGKYFARMLASVSGNVAVRDVQFIFFKTLSTSLCLFIGVIIALNILGLEKIAISILAGGGVTAIVVGFAFREIGENFLAGIFLAFSRPFKIGDAIRTEDIEGKVQAVEIRYTHLRTDDGRDVYVPSSQLFSRPVINFTRDGLRRISFTVGIDYSNDAKAACDLLKNSIEKIEGVLAEPGPGALIDMLGPQYVELQVYFWVDLFDRDRPVYEIRTQVMDNCRVVLLQEGYIISSETTTNIAITNGD